MLNAHQLSSPAVPAAGGPGEHRVGTQEKIAGLASMLQLAKLLPGTHVLQLKKIIRKIFKDENSEFVWSPEIPMLVALSCPPRGCGARGVICKGT